MKRLFSILALLSLLTACSEVTKDLAGPVEPLGNFKLGHAEVVAPNLQKLLVSREATAEEWIAEVDGALERRFRRFDGDQFYHLGVSVEAYSLPPPVVPGKSALAVRLTVWDDAAKKKLNEESEVFHVIQVFESRIASSREDSMRLLAETVARDIEVWLREQMVENDWFGGVPAPAPEPQPEAAEVAEAATEASE